MYIITTFSFRVTRFVEKGVTWYGVLYRLGIIIPAYGSLFTILHATPLIKVRKFCMYTYTNARLHVLYIW